ncbi:MAG TPA: sugar ABC transporter permease [Desulfurococcaceae archaeon]|nr:sugar ABC transporter permease [Desulfurococcaceae archaeon]
MPSPKLEKWFTVSILLGPPLIFIVIFYFLPVALTIAIAFTNMDYRFQWNFIGFKNFERMIKDPILPKILMNTLFYVFATLTLFNVGYGLLLAIFTSFVPPKFGNTVRLLWLLPRLSPPVVYYLLWLGLTNPYPYGLINYFLVDVLGLKEYADVYWIYKAPWAVIILANGFVGASFGMLIIGSAIKAIPIDVVRAAKVDGAGMFRMIKDIILPILKWPILFVTAYQTLSLLTSFEYILLLTDGGPGFYTTEVWALYVYHKALSAFGGFEYAYGAALSLILVVLGLALSILYFKIFRFREMILEPKIEV